MARKQIRVSGGMLFTWFLLAGLIFLFAPQNLTNRFQFAFARIFQWPLSMGRNISLFARTLRSSTDISNRKESQYLNYINNLKEELRQEREKVERLAGLRNRTTWQGVKFVLADISRASSSSYSKLFINRGQNDGLAKGQFVLGDNSIIGTISDVSPRTAVVKLMTDPTSRIAVRIAGVNADRLMQGTGNNSAKVQLLSTKNEVKVGDKVQARKTPGLLDVPMIVGTVTRCKRDQENPLLWDITVDPVCDIETLNSIAIIVMNPQK